MPESDYYGVAALGYLDAVHRYFNEPKLARYSFSTIAYRAMRQSVFRYRRSLARPDRHREALSLDTDGVEGAPLRCGMTEAERALLADAEERLLLHALAQSLTAEQYDLVRLRVQGYGLHEIAARQGVSDKRVRRMLRQVREVFWKVCQQ